MNDDELIERFESLSLPEDGFHHREHVLLTLAYLRRLPVIEVLRRMSCGLAALARARGRPERYHETITWAHVFLVRECMARGGLDQTREQFVAANPALFDRKQSVLQQYYCE
jgi:hypothetical protein